ncbi:Divalent metal cation transporter MntH [Neomoorella glycerini]|uniref:Divalent metal cation transporter MntH n=1 Tax=Neomoorella glycerini TaxID=55779 RepID=A0A6I5ZQV2_9FIRM|nr:Nramp family divalent metal transporter [Moorella glycerini]QGP92039.1 Divalent metal cation transporter MntH [Moorella glycerini]
MFLKKILSLIGPAFITAAVVLGPGSITTSTKAGSLLGYSILWAVLLASVMMVFYTRMGAAIGVATGQSSLMQIVTQKYGRWLAVLLGLSGFLICAGFQTGNNLGVGLAMSSMFGGTVALWAVIFTIVALALMWSSSSIYQVLEKLMMALVAVMIISFVGNLLMIRPDSAGIIKGFIPGKPGNFGLVVAISATTFSVAAAAFQAYLVKGKGWGKDDYRKAMQDATAGIIVLGAITMVIMITSAAVLLPKGIKVNTAVEMALQLEPLLGPLAKWLFLIGLWAAAFSSFIVNAMIGGTMLADGLGIGSTMDGKWPKLLASLVMILGTAVASIYKTNPIQLLIMAQATTILGVPLLAGVMILLANDKQLMGELRNNLVSNIIAVVAFLWLVYLSIRQLLTFLG